MTHHTAMVGVGTRTARFGERSEYEGSRVPASTISLHAETCANAA